ncbi:c-type cytochrome [Fodinibius sediminis]|nr:c-type cytochrome [Fodinibius sediminis]
MNTDRTEMGIGPFLMVLLVPLLMVAYEVSLPEEHSPVNLHSAVPEDTSDSIQTLPGFEVQLVYRVPREEQGSWVGLTVDPKGRLIASDQQAKGMYRIRVNDDNPDSLKVDVEEIIMPASGAQGMAWAFGQLYANVNGKGLFRLKDTKGNDQFNVMEYLGGPQGRGEHGNHAVFPTENNKELYVVNGNHTAPPDFTSTRVTNWEEDILLPRQWDARGHARGILAPGGYIARINPMATQWDIISIGYRNTYDAAINQDGELFTYDADMEWDMGMPWYRPTRIVHSVSGSDYGWRSGSGKWKQYFEDSLPPVFNVGPGSPTGVLFGTGAQFPAKYQRALFGLDWTFGTMYAFHLTPEGASYTAEAEEFLSGSPLPLTDAVIGKDGAMYFLTGGRDKESKLYRVTYTGDESTAPAEPVENAEAEKARAERHELEAFHGRQDPEAVETAWPYLNSNDRFLRHAARVAVEWQPVESWAEKVLAEKDPQARITGMIALARKAPEKYREEAIEALLAMDLEALSPEQKLGYLRAMALVFMRLGDPAEDSREQITDTLQKLLPHEDDRVNVELVRLLVYLKDERVIDKALALMRSEEKPGTPDWGGLLARNENYGGTIQDMIDNPPPTNKLEYAFMLRNMSEGWTIDQRREYFTFINNAADAMGGASYTGFLERVRDEALVNASEEEREAVEDLTAQSLAHEPPFEIKPPEGPGREWTVKEAVEAVEGNLENRNFENGRNAFFAISCASCHQFDSYGGAIGPNLSTVGQNLSTQGLLEDIITPSAVISSQYNSSEVKLKDGDTISGLVVEEEEYVKVYGRDPDEGPTIIPSEEVASIEPVEVSQMPPGLVNSLSAEELRDLVAYLKSGGDEENEMFVQEENK